MAYLISDLFRMNTVMQRRADEDIIMKMNAYYETQGNRNQRKVKDQVKGQHQQLFLKLNLKQSPHQVDEKLEVEILSALLGVHPCSCKQL